MLPVYRVPRATNRWRAIQLLKEGKISHVPINIFIYLRVNKIDGRDCVTRCYFIALGTLVNSERTPISVYGLFYVYLGERRVFLLIWAITCLIVSP